MRIGFFGGSFDPPHRGHLAAAQAAREAFALDQVLLAPVAIQPLKEHGGQASYANRLHMASLLAQNGNGLLASKVDGPRVGGQPNYTVKALLALRAQEPAATVFSLVGLDAFCGLRRWRQPEKLLALAEWIVVSRPGSSFDDLEALELSDAQRKRVHLLRSVHVPVSATEVRTRLAAGESCTDLVPANVLAFIYERHLYGS